MKYQLKKTVDIIMPTKDYEKGVVMRDSTGDLGWLSEYDFNAMVKMGELRKADNWLDRVHIEFAELYEKIEKLYDFLDTDAYEEMETNKKNALLAQLSAMNEYGNVLTHRVLTQEHGEDLFRLTFKFGIAIEFLMQGFPVRRICWDSRKFLVRQNSNVVEPTMIQNMTSLPEEVKKVMATNTKGLLKYHDQILLVKVSNNFSATYWAPQHADLFADDWEVMTEDRAKELLERLIMDKGVGMQVSEEEEGKDIPAQMEEKEESYE